MSIRDDLISVVDDIRDEVVDTTAGLRYHDVVVRVTTWSGGAPGRGTPSNSDTTLSPRPKVRNPSPRMLYAAPGKYQAGGRVIDKISLTYTEDDLTGGALAAGQSCVWLIDTDEYELVGAPEEHFLGWKVVVRKRRS